MLRINILSKLALFLSVLFIFTVVPVSADDPVPAWMQNAMRQTVPTYEIKDVPAVVLHNEQIVTMNSDGNLSITTNYAVKLLRREGKAYADAVVPYLQSASKVRDLEAWLVRPNGTVRFLGKKEMLDIVSDPDDIYNEYRVKVLDASNEAAEGFTFGYQATVEEKPLFYQDVWRFQDRLPTLLSRYTLNLPNGWKASNITFNRAQVEPTLSGSNYIWELKNLAPIPPEPSSPLVRNLAPMIAVNYSPQTGNAINRAFSTWREVARWTAEMHEGQVIVDDLVAGKARELTVNAKTEFEKIQAIGRFVQNMQYISIDIGIGYGNGYRPRSSSMVLQRGYGDCKDKANLMRAMLKSLKIEAYPVAIFSGDPTFTRPEWASPMQFNHCIIAIKVSPETNAPTVITHPTLGRLMIFDATDDNTPVGDLPEHEQGSYALIGATEGDLVKMPILPPELNGFRRESEITLSETGAITGKISERALGQAAASFRGEFRALGASKYSDTIQSWLGRNIAGAKVAKVTPTDNQIEGKFDLDVEFSAASYAQLQQNRLLVFKPALVGKMDRISLSDEKRYHPVIFDSESYTETVKIKLPAGFIVDETPDAVSLETEFGKYAVSFDVKDGQLIFNRSLKMQRATIPADKYESVRKFFAQIRSVDQAPVVLLRK